MNPEANFSQAPEGPYVTISREAGAGATTFAGMLARRLNAEPDGGLLWTVFDANLIQAMLQANHLSPEIANYLPEGRVSEINALIGEIVGLHPNLWSLIQKTNSLTRELARKGGAIFVGRGAVFSTAGIANGVHLRLVAPKEVRARSSAKRLGIPLEEAAASNRQKDAARRAYVRTNFNAHGPDPTAYDFVINTARVPLPEAAELIASVIRASAPASGWRREPPMERQRSVIELIRRSSSGPS
jgi:cytidylate kinase